MAALDSWAVGSHTAAGITHQTLRKGTGPGVVVIHESPGITPQVLVFAEDVVQRGFTTVLPSLSGTPGRPDSLGYGALATVRICVSREIAAFAMGRTPPVATWLRSLARELHAELGGPGVGVVGMCFTGGYALAMLADAPVAAPVLAQPSAPGLVGRARRADLQLSPADLDAVRTKVAAGCPVLGLRYVEDRYVGTRFDTLRRELGANFVAVELPDRKHSTLVRHRDQTAVDRVLDFLDERLRGPGR